MNREPFTGFLAVFTLLAAACVAAQAPVETPEAAVAAARSAWRAIDQKQNGRVLIYRSEAVARFEPYTATLRDGVWIVRGTVPAGYRGEMLESTVRQSNGAVSVIAVFVGE